MNKEEELQEVTKQLQDLQLKQGDLLARLEVLTRVPNEDTEEGQTSPTQAKVTTRVPAPVVADRQTPESRRAFVVGDIVRILNPRPQQPNTGVVKKIGASKITVETANGTKVQRAPHNIAYQG